MGSVVIDKTSYILHSYLLLLLLLLLLLFTYYYHYTLELANMHIVILWYSTVLATFYSCYQSAM